MTLEKKLLELQIIFDDSELIHLINSTFDEESANEVILDFKKKIIELLEK